MLELVTQHDIGCNFVNKEFDLMTTKVMGFIVIAFIMGCTNTNLSTNGQAENGKPKPKKPTYVYYDLPVIDAPLRASKKFQNLRTVISLGITKGQHEKAITKILKKNRDSILRDLRLYFATQKPEDLQGNLNRLAKEIQNNLNTKLWSSADGGISNVLFREFLVQ